jgi:hypothetical protein
MVILTEVVYSLSQSLYINIVLPYSYRFIFHGVSSTLENKVETEQIKKFENELITDSPYMRPVKSSILNGQTKTNYVKDDVMTSF